jgi:type IV pilus assembly protein PilM
MSVVGLNLGKSSIRAIELEKRKDGIYVNNFGSYDNPRLNLESKDKDDIDTFASSLRNFFSEVGFTTPNVVIGLHESSIFMRVIKLPRMSEKELKTSVKFEAEQYIPLPYDQINLSYKLLDPDFTDKNKVNVQIVAAKKDVLENYVALSKKAGLVVKTIEPETIALGRALGDTPEAPLGTMILKMGYSGTLIVVVYGGYTRFTRSVPIGGDSFTRAIQQELALEPNQAEDYKKAYGLDKFQAEGKVYEILKPITDSLIMEVKRASIFFTKHNSSASIKRVILSGGTAIMPGLLTYIANNLDVEVQVANPLKNLIISPKLEKQKASLIEYAPSYSTAIGLALRGI